VRESTAPFSAVCPVTLKAESITTSTLSCTIDSPITDDSLQPIIDDAIKVATVPITRDLRLFVKMRDIISQKQVNLCVRIFIDALNQSER
jgi:hypothetical protein